MKWIGVVVLALLLCGSALAQSYCPVDHSGAYIVAVSSNTVLTLDGHLWYLHSDIGWEDMTGTESYPVPPVPIQQLAYWAQAWSIDTNGYGWYWNDVEWLNLGQIPGFVPSGVATPEAMPSKFQLGAMPNPSQRSASIRYVLPETADVLVQVNDVSGRVVDVLVNQSQSAGTHTQLWEPKSVAAGIYFVVMIAQGEMRSCKVVLTK